MTKISSYVIFSSAAILLMMARPSEGSAGKCGLTKAECEECKSTWPTWNRCVQKEDNETSTSDWCCAGGYKLSFCDSHSECKKKCTKPCVVDIDSYNWPCWECKETNKPSEPRKPYTYRSESSSLSVGAIVGIVIALVVVTIVIPIVLCCCLAACPLYFYFRDRNQPVYYGQPPMRPMPPPTPVYA